GRTDGRAAGRRRLAPDQPLLVGAAVAGPLVDGAAVGLGGPVDVEAFAAVSGHELGIAAVGGNQLPLLVGAAVAGPLVDRGAVGLRAAVDVEALAAVLDDHVVV